LVIKNRRNGDRKKEEEEEIGLLEECVKERFHRK